jgi:uncharacterized protein
MVQPDVNAVLAATENWLTRAVIGLGLCPFAAQIVREGRLHLAVSDAHTPGGLLEDLALQLRELLSMNPAERETTLLIHPWVLGDFYDFNEFLAACDRTLVEMDLEGVIQIASFHPQYQFAGTTPQDLGNCSNRSPYPTLQLLREESVARATAHLADPEEIYQANIRTLEALGADGWARLWRE